MEDPLLIRLSPAGNFYRIRIHACPRVRMSAYKIIIKAKAKAFAVYDISYACAKSPARTFSYPHIRMFESVYPLKGMQGHPGGKHLDQFEKFRRDFFPKESRKLCCILPGYFLEFVQKIIPKKSRRNLYKFPASVDRIKKSLIFALLK